MIPDHLKYTSQHEWALITETGTVRFGITDHAQDALGDIVFVTLPEPGSTLTAGETCGEIESTKSVAEIYSPVSGEVVSRNDVVETSPESINADPYGGGWLAEVAPADPGALDALLSAAEYEALIAE
ncbi:MAG: glycine cleavage system protein GcvH [Candidatus Nanopelagicales bacterium]|jgi:glycine cleavage system H protein